MMLSTAVSSASAEKLSAPSETEELWYGWQTLLIDGSVLLLLPFSLSADTQNAVSSAGFSVAAGSYALGGPIVHLAHGNYGRGIGSFALRAPLALLAVAALPPWFSTEPDDSLTRTLATLVAVVLGSNALAVSFIDTALLSYEIRERKPRGATLQLTPRFTPGDRSAGLVLNGTF
jgi:hypothetical protein